PSGDDLDLYSFPTRRSSDLELILGHLADSYEWHVWSNGEKHITISLPVILHSKSSGWHFFSSSKFNHGNSSYNGFQIASEGEYKDRKSTRLNSSHVKISYAV